MMRTVGNFDDEVAFMVERLSWFDFVNETNLAAWDDWAFAVVDEELLRALGAATALG